jgi:glycosyltransferase involved in cell wall biosynthesis
MPNDPVVSVLVTCFNLGQYLEEAIDSVLAQTQNDLEILIVDDGSTDNDTRLLLDRFDRPRTTVFRTSNQGLARARNFLLARARGRYVSNLDADDRFHPEFLARTVAVLDQHPELTFVATHLRMFGDEQGVWPRDSRCDVATLLSEDTVITPALVRRDAINAVGGFDEAMPHQGDEDWELWLRLVAAGYSGVILPDQLFDYRRRRGSMCDQCTSRETHLDLYAYLLQKHAAACSRHLLPVLLRKEERIGELRRINVTLEAELQDLKRIRSSKTRQLANLRLKLDRHAAHSHAVPDTTLSPDLPGEYQRARDEIAALRSSWSWRLSAPLRATYDLVSGRSRRRRQ